MGISHDPTNQGDIVRVRRKVLLVAGAVALPLTLASVVFAGPANAGGGPPFSGAATGKVTCSAPKITIKFSPKMTLTSGGTTITAKGVLKGCATSGSNIGTVKTGKITSTFSGTGGGCAGLASGTVTPETFTISWKGTKTTANGKATLTDTTATIHGAAPATNGAGDVGFTLPNPAAPPGSSSSGSFAGAINNSSSVFSNLTTSALTAKCSKPGLSTLKITSGAITLP
jgi:hypothetical protein